jgi:hypothetical protein
VISFLHPGFLYAAFGVAAGIVALHFLVTEQPRTGMLPTVRFFPDLPARATTLTLRLSDLLLLAMRVLTALLVGAAFAQPRINPTHRIVARIVAVDLSDGSGSIREVRDSALAYIGDSEKAAAVVLFDSVAREVDVGQAVDSLRDLADGATARRPPGSISPALIASLRVASRVRERADSVEIVLVSPLVTAEHDAATLVVRSSFPGRIRLVRVAPDTTRVDMEQRVRVEWADSAVSTVWVRLERIDTVGAVDATLGGATSVLVFPFERRWRLASAATGATRVVARWMDGEPAAVEALAGGECLRSIGFALPTVGDIMLRSQFVRFGESLAKPCTPAGSAADRTPLPADFVRALQGPRQRAPAAAIAPRVTRMTPLVPWLLVAALLVALTELWVRRRQTIAQAKGVRGPTLAAPNATSIGAAA